MEGGISFESRVNETDTWLTPPEILKRLGSFDLDPCAAPDQPWPTAREHYVLPENNGLLLPWKGRVWCNPPYGNETIHWIERMALHGNGILLIFARTETEAFSRVWSHADAIMFLKGRIKFYKPDGTPGDNGMAPSALVAYGESNVEALRVSGMRGALVTRWERLSRSGSAPPSDVSELML